MPRPRPLFIALVVSVAVAIGFAFTVIGLIAKTVAILALAALAFRGVTSIVRHAR